MIFSARKVADILFVAPINDSNQIRCLFQPPPPPYAGILGIERLNKTFFDAIASLKFGVEE